MYGSGLQKDRVRKSEQKQEGQKGKRAHTGEEHTGIQYFVKSPFSRMMYKNNPTDKNTKINEKNIALAF